MLTGNCLNETATLGNCCDCQKCRNIWILIRCEGEGFHRRKALNPEQPQQILFYDIIPVFYGLITSKSQPLQDLPVRFNITIGFDDFA